MADDKDTTNIYFNVSIANPATATTAVLCQSSQTYSQNILGDISEFKGSIIRMSMPLSAMPYFLCPNNFYYFTLSYAGVDYKQAVTLIPYSSAAPTAVYYINQFIDSCNVALAAANTLVKAANPTVLSLATSATSPRPTVCATAKLCAIHK